MANVKISELPLGIPNSTSIFPFVDSGTTYQGAISAITSNGGGVTEVTYSELVDKINGETLNIGSYYIITDFQTCYDVPEYYVNGDAKGNGNVDYRQGGVDPIIVLATSVNTISSTAYQPSYPNDRIQYDWTWNATEITGGDAYGRIFERIDEYNNRTDYDHRTIFFNRFQSYNKGSQLTGTINSYNSATGIITGNDTLFLDEISDGDVFLFQETGVKVVSATTNTELLVVVDPTFTGINFTGGLIPFYTLLSTGNYYEYKEVYVGQKISEDWNDYLTFNLNGTAVHNYVGDYSRFYIEDNTSNSGFLLANNVFYGNDIYSNTIGDRSYNNTGRYWFVRNTIAGRFYNNVIYNNGFYSNSIGEYFNNNIIKASMYKNTIEQNFNTNTIYSQFYDNKISNDFNENIIYSEFYENQIGLNFNNNTIGDNGNLSNFNFYRNRIGNDFYSNTIRQTFQNNQIGNQFHDNFANGNFYKNVIGNGFNYNNNIGYDFYGNHIGNGFNGNELIGDYFHDNQIGEYFNNNNSISYGFNNNQIGNIFENNTLGDNQYFNWSDLNIENLTARTYNTFYNSLEQNIGNVILGKELIMHFSRNSGTTQSIGNLVIGETYEITDVAFVGGDFSNVADVIDGTINEVGCIFISTGTQPTSWCGITVTELTSYDEYHIVGFTQWTQNANGGGFSYERTKVYPTSEPTVYFTKTNYGPEVDVIISGRLEIRRNNNGGIYNDVVENNFNSNVSPVGTEWNSIYTQPYNGSNFEYNTIVNEFKGNYIRGDFQVNTINSYVGNNQFSGNTYSNNFGDYTFGNDFLGSVFSNSCMAGFNSNTIGENFSSNNIGFGFSSNVIGENFGYGASTPQGNIIGNYFYDNTIGEYFYNNTIADNFVENTIDNYFQWNIVNTAVSGVCLSTGMLYDITTVNVFKNKNGDNRLSYYDESDVLTVETLTEAPCLGGLNALDIPENDLNFGLVINPSFTITSSDFTDGYPIDTDTTPLGPNGTSGFTNTASQNSLIDGYRGQGLSGTSLTGLTNAYNSLGLDLNNSVGRLWYVTWGSGSTISSGVVKFGSYVNGESFDIQTIDTSDTNYLTPNTGDGTSLVGTFLFPATFTIYYPITDKTGWC